MQNIKNVILYSFVFFSSILLVPSQKNRNEHYFPAHRRQTAMTLRIRNSVSHPSIRPVNDIFSHVRDKLTSQIAVYKLRVTPLDYGHEDDENVCDFGALRSLVSIDRS